MLRTDDRLLLSEALAPPPDHQLDMLVGTTYSLNLAALLSVPLSLTFANWEDEHGTPTSEPVAALAAVRRLADRITVFCQAGATAATEQPPLVVSWLEDVVVPVKAPFDGVFHPKVWVARYKSLGAGPCYRVLCGSRNLTFDQCWDTVAVVDGEPTPRGGRREESKSLADFVSQLPSIAVGSVDATRRTAIVELADELRRVRFTPPEGFSSLAFWPMGIRGHQTDPLQSARRRRLLVISPFIGAGRLSGIAGEQQNDILISRDEELTRIPITKLDGFSEVYVLDQPESLEEAGDDSALSGLHAKMYVAEDGRDVHMWTGSANATSGAARTNVEFLVQLDGPKHHLGIDELMSGEPGSLREMLHEAELRAVPEEPCLRERLLRELDDIAHCFAERRIEARVTSTDEADFDVTLQTGQPVSLPPGVTATCWPLTRLADRDWQPIPDGEAVLARFVRQQLAEITAFFVCSFELSRDGESVAKRMIVRADLIDAPENRAEAILRELLKSPADFLRLIRALLHFDGGGVASAFLPTLETGGTMAWGEAGETPLLEALLRALEEAPGQLDAVRDILNDFHDDEHLIPPELMEICSPILSVYAESRQ